MTSAIELAFELGRASIVGKADHDEAERILDALEKRAKGAENGGTESGRKIKAAADEPLRVLKDVWRAYRGQFGDGHALVKEVFARPRKCKYGDGSGKERVFVPDVGEERARALFGEWAREEKWAAGWVAVGDEYHQDTHDKYRVALFQEDGSWRLRIKAPNRLEWTPKGSGSMDEARAAGYTFVELLRKRARAEARDQKARRTGKIAARLPPTT